MANIIQNHPLRFSIAASSFVPWIYLGQFWHTLQEDGSKYRLKFMLDRKEITMTLNDFRRIFHLPQATDNNHERFVAAPKFLEMFPFFLNTLGFTLELRSPSNFKTTGLVQPWETLGKIFARYYVDLLWEGLHYALEHSSTQIPYPKFTKLIVGHYMTVFLEISRRARDKYHNLEDDAMVKNIFNSGKHKDGVGMKILSWMFTDEMQLTDHYRMYDVVFGVDVPTTQSQLIESTQGMHKTTSAPRRLTRLTPPTPILTTAEADDIILQDTIQLSLAEQKSHDELEAKQNRMLRLIVLPLGKMILKIFPALEEEESAEDEYELKRREKWNHVEESRSTPSPTTIRSPRTHSTLVSSDTEKLLELTVTDPPPSSSTPSSFSSKSNITATNRLLSLFKPKRGRFKRYRNFFDELQG
ncbi:hypothetical protein Tco_0948633 [Tanacetum coccineum]